MNQYISSHYGGGINCKYGGGVCHTALINETRSYSSSLYYKTDAPWNNYHYIQWKSSIRLEDSNHLFNIIVQELKLEAIHY